MSAKVGHYMEEKEEEEEEEEGQLLKRHVNTFKLLNRAATSEAKTACSNSQKNLPLNQQHSMWSWFYTKKKRRTYIVQAKPCVFHALMKNRLLSVSGGGYGVISCSRCEKGRLVVAVWSMHQYLGTESNTAYTQLLWSGFHGSWYTVFFTLPILSTPAKKKIKKKISKIKIKTCEGLVLVRKPNSGSNKHSKVSPKMSALF